LKYSRNFGACLQTLIFSAPKYLSGQKK